MGAKILPPLGFSEYVKNDDTYQCETSNTLLSIDSKSSILRQDWGNGVLVTSRFDVLGKKVVNIRKPPKWTFLSERQKEKAKRYKTYRSTKPYLFLFYFFDWGFTRKIKRKNVIKLNNSNILIWSRRVNMSSRYRAQYANQISKQYLSFDGSTAKKQARKLLTSLFKTHFWHFGWRTSNKMSFFNPDTPGQEWLVFEENIEFENLTNFPYIDLSSGQTSKWMSPPSSKS